LPAPQLTVYFLPFKAPTVAAQLLVHAAGQLVAALAADPFRSALRQTNMGH
jgi:hypothetical protein